MDDLDRLWARVGRGDAGAWGEVVERTQSLVYSVARRRGLDRDDAEDVFVTAFQALHANRDRIASGRAVPRWLATTAARESLRLRRLRRPEEGGDALDEILIADERDAEAEALRADEARRVREGLAALAPRCRDLLAALYDEASPAYAEIAARLGMPVGAIGPTRARCLEKLRKILESEGFFA